MSAASLPVCGQNTAGLFLQPYLQLSSSFLPTSSPHLCLSVSVSSLHIVREGVPSILTLTAGEVSCRYSQQCVSVTGPMSHCPMRTKLWTWNADCWDGAMPRPREGMKWLDSEQKILLWHWQHFATGPICVLVKHFCPVSRFQPSFGTETV